MHAGQLKHIKTRKRHRCDWCNGWIESGSVVPSWFYADDGIAATLRCIQSAIERCRAKTIVVKTGLPLETAHSVVTVGFPLAVSADGTASAVTAGAHSTNADKHRLPVAQIATITQR
jgi:hypothetical protein